MPLAFHDLPRKKSDQLVSLLGAILKNAWIQISKINFKLKRYTQSQDIRTKYIRGVNLIWHYQFACVQLNKIINHMLGHVLDLKSLHIYTDSDWKHPDGRSGSEFLKKVWEKVEYQINLFSLIMWSHCHHHPFNFLWFSWPIDNNSQ